MKYAILPSVSSLLYTFGNMDEFSSPDSDNPPAETIDSNLSFYGNSFCVEPKFYNLYQQPDHRACDVPLHGPMMMDYQQHAEPSSLLMTTGKVDNSLGLTQQSFSLGQKLPVPEHQNVQKSPGKRVNLVHDQRAEKKKKKIINQEESHLHKQDYEQAMECLRERVPMRRSQKLSDKITALQKLVSPYGKTDTASVLQEACISIKLLHNQIQKLLQRTETTSIDAGPLGCHFQNTGEAKPGLRSKGLCLAPISTSQKIMMRLEQMKNPCQEDRRMMPRNYWSA